MYTDYLRHVQKLSMEQRGQLFTAILCYTSGEALPELDLATDMIFGVIQERIDRDTALYLEKVEKRREAGKLGGRPKANDFSENQEKAKKANGFSEKQNNPDNEYVNDNDNIEYPADVAYFLVEGDSSKIPENSLELNKVFESMNSKEEILEFLSYVGMYELGYIFTEVTSKDDSGKDKTIDLYDYIKPGIDRFPELQELQIKG